MSDHPGGPAAPRNPDDPTPDQPTPSAEPTDGPGASPADRPEARPVDNGGPQPGPYRGVFGGAVPPVPPVGGDQPGPYGGAFGQPAGGYGQPGTPPGTAWGQPPAYGYQPGPVAPPKQVTIASAISFGLGGLCVLLGLFALTAAGDQIAEMLMGDAGSRGVVAAVILICAVAYILPAIFVRKRRPWARIMLIVVAAFGIIGGVTALPGSLLGLALHVTLLVMMLQQPTKLWFTHR